MSQPDESTLQAVLQALAGRLPPERLDRLWIFAPRPLGEGQSGLVVVAALVPSDAALRDVFTLRYQTERGRGGRLKLESTLAEQARAPAERVPRVIHGVLARLGEDAEEPRVEEVGGDAARFARLLGNAGPVDPDRQE